MNTTPESRLIVMADAAATAVRRCIVPPSRGRLGRAGLLMYTDNAVPMKAPERRP